MTQEALGIQFQETLSGGFALGTSDPERGLIEGKLTGCAMSIHNVITIEDLSAFYAHPDHPAELAATVDFMPFGQAIPTQPGSFHLFKPSESHQVKLMIYRFAFEWQQQPYFFEGKKFIHDGSSILKLWEESTTLYSRLYRGTDESGVVAGAGVLQISVLGVVDLIRSIQVTGTESKVKATEVKAQFGKFFLGELWNTYRSHSGD